MALYCIEFTPDSLRYRARDRICGGGESQEYIQGLDGYFRDTIINHVSFSDRALLVVCLVHSSSTVALQSVHSHRKPGTFLAPKATWRYRHQPRNGLIHAPTPHATLANVAAKTVWSTALQLSTNSSISRGSPEPSTPVQLREMPTNSKQRLLIAVDSLPLLLFAFQVPIYTSKTPGAPARTCVVCHLSLVSLAKVGVVRRVIMGLDRVKKSPCGFCFVE